MPFKKSYVESVKGASGTFTIHSLANSYGIYNNGGVKVAEVPRNQYVDATWALERTRKMAEALAANYTH